LLFLLKKVKINLFFNINKQSSLLSFTEKKNQKSKIKTLPTFISYQPPLYHTIHINQFLFHFSSKKDLSNTLNVREISNSYRVFNNSILTYIFENTTLFQKPELKGWLANLSPGNLSLSLSNLSGNIEGRIGKLSSMEGTSKGISQYEKKCCWHCALLPPIFVCESRPMH
jgi:hypothetical protein